MTTRTEPDTDVAEAAPDSRQWAWLADTYWYVPEAYLPAIRQTNLRDARTTTVQDQTVWWFERFEGGYLTGRTAISVDGGDFTYYTLLGSVTPEGAVLLSFSPEDASVTSATDAPVTGSGRLVRFQGAWAFLMQMISGANAVCMAHWAYMVQATPDSDAWTSLPGVPEVGVGDVFS